MTPPSEPRRDRPAERRRKLRDTFGEFNPADAPPMGGDRARPPAEPPLEVDQSIQEELMASKTEVIVRVWECDSCGTEVRSNSTSRDLPQGWTDNAIIHLSVGSKGLDLCPNCSADPESAKRHAKAKWGQ